MKKTNLQSGQDLKRFGHRSGLSKQPGWSFNKINVGMEKFTKIFKCLSMSKFGVHSMKVYKINERDYAKPMQLSYIKRLMGVVLEVVTVSLVFLLKRSLTLWSRATERELESLRSIPTSSRTYIRTLISTQPPKTRSLFRKTNLKCLQQILSMCRAANRKLKHFAWELEISMKVGA